LTPDNTLYQPSVASDIYALAMVIYEVSIDSSPMATVSDQDQVLTGTPPFARRGKTELACKVVLEGERPPRPRDSEKLGFTDRVWESLQRCWEKKPSARPSVDAISACLKHAAETWEVDVPAFMLASRAGVEQVMNMREDQAKDFADRLTEVCSRGTRPHPLTGVLILIFIPDTQSDRYQPELWEDILEVSPEAMRRIRGFAGLIHAHRRVRYHRAATVCMRWVRRRVQGDLQGTASGSKGSQNYSFG